MRVRGRAPPIRRPAGRLRLGIRRRSDYKGMTSRAGPEHEQLREVRFIRR